jgi:excinuclease ABC subunit B
MNGDFLSSEKPYSFRTPTTIEKTIRTLIESEHKEMEEGTAGVESFMSPDDLNRIIAELEQEMREAAGNLEFERAAAIRDQITEMKAGL